MTIEMVLGTAKTEEKVLHALNQVGFMGEKSKTAMPYTSDKGFYVQVHAPSFLQPISGVKTEIELISQTDNPDVNKVLEALYELLPDLQYSEDYAISKPPTIKPVSELFDRPE